MVEKEPEGEVMYPVDFASGGLDCWESEGGGGAVEDGGKVGGRGE